MTRTNSNTDHLRFVEPGTAYMELAGLDGGPASLGGGAARDHVPTRTEAAERFDVVVIGGGQAGLSVGYHLQRQGLRFVIVDASERIGDAWRKRWDSLRLFSPARLDGLDGLPFPGPRNYYPTKDEMADYLEGYAEHFALPVRSGSRVEKLEKQAAGYRVKTSRGELYADQVIVAMSSYQKPEAPPLARELRSDIVQLHSSTYKNPGQLRDGNVLVVGGGNSGVEVAMDLVRTHKVWLSRGKVAETPFRPGTRLGNILGFVLLRGVFHRLLTIRTALGRKARPAMLVATTPLIRTKSKDLAHAGVLFAPKIVGVKDGLPVTEDGRVLDVQNIVWSTGYSNAASFIDLPIFDGEGEPMHEGGVVPSAPGLYFVGLHWLFSMSSAMVHGVGRDAQRVVAHAAERARAGVAA